MSWIYVTEPGAKLSREGGRYIISRANETICEVPLAVVEGVTLFDSIQVTSSAIVDLLERNIPLTWLSSTGKFFGRLESTERQNVLRQKEQFDALSDTDFCENLAKKVVFGKIYNQRTVLRNYNRRANDPFVAKTMADIRMLADKLHTVHRVDEIMGYEGMMARLYFQALGHILPPAFQFEKRTRRPPRDYFNSLLSFGYTLLMYDFYSAIVNCGLHPYIGFLHALRNGHPALASDLMEAWRPAIVDSFCLSLVTHREVSKEYFVKGENGGVYLNRIGRRIFLQAYERKMRTMNRYFQGEYSWRHTVQMECDSYSLAVHYKDAERLKPLVIR